MMIGRRGATLSMGRAVKVLPSVAMRRFSAMRSRPLAPATLAGVTPPGAPRLATASQSTSSGGRCALAMWRSARVRAMASSMLWAVDRADSGSAVCAC